MNLNRIELKAFLARTFFSCALLLTLAVSGSAQEKLRALVKVDSFPYLHNELDTAGYRPDTTRIFFTQKKIVYQLYYTEGSIVRAADGTDIHTSRKRSFWLVQERDSSYGYAFDEHRPHAQKWMHIDSTLTGHGMLRFQINLSDTGKLRRVQSVTEPSTGILHEAYVMTDAAKYPKDTIYFSHSTRMNDIPFSLNKEIDAYTKKKLFVVKFVTGEKEMLEKKVKVPGTAILTRFEEIPVTNPEEVLKYIEQFRLIGKRNTN